MRDTARLQVLALALIGAIAWISLDVTDLRWAMAGWVHDTPASAPASAPVSAPAEPGGALLDAPVLGEDLPPSPLRIGHPHPRFWVVEMPPEAYVG